MPGNPEECREHAANCRQLAQSASVATAREAFLNLANTWERLASELESAQRFLQAIDTIERKEAFRADQRSPFAPPQDKYRAAVPNRWKTKN
jgi:hypothetical protein